LLAEHRPTHLVAIERPGRARDGHYRSARGLSLSEWNGALDELFLAASARTVTVGVGDGGNEVGMGNVRARVARAGGVFPRIASVVKVKHLVVAGVSNWGAYGIVAELARLAGRTLLHSGEEEQAMVAACVEAGAVDGLTHRPEPTVDGLPLPAHIGMLELLRVLESPRRTGGPSK
ncbi:MAG TPA: glutamate cyclase domain-containing protein, partial [Methylomirabilota bacterium]|nr:glutamate cyclase domain-containing protein [Methylomirabilota bacterium]